MAFFENIGKQISNVTQNVAQQTKNLADITQLNNLISEKRGKIQQLYQNLGQIYYESHHNDPLAEQLDMIQQINTLRNEVVQCKDKISQIRGSNICPNCGKEIPADAQFCTSCGTKIEKLPSAAKEITENLCSNCGAVITEGSLFCSECGNRL